MEIRAINNRWPSLTPPDVLALPWHVREFLTEWLLTEDDDINAPVDVGDEALIEAGITIRVAD